MSLTVKQLRASLAHMDDDLLVVMETDDGPQPVSNLLADFDTGTFLIGLSPAHRRTLAR